jgi:hypothetical protein
MRFTLPLPGDRVVAGLEVNVHDSYSYGRGDRLLALRSSIEDRGVLGTTGSRGLCALRIDRGAFVYGTAS